MGLKFFDTYSLLHFSVGIVFYYWDIRFDTSIIIHLIYEIIENTPLGMMIISKLPLWPGEKTYADAIINSIGDTFFFGLGWKFAQIFDIVQQ
ncbi:MAG: hypothetical protein N2B06_04795 [Clostridium sp.]